MPEPFPSRDDGRRRPASRVPAHRRDVGYVAQDGALFPHLTVGQNIAYGLDRQCPQRPAPGSPNCSQTVSLDESMRRRRPHELSGGQQQRVALARALARDPALMLLDEPFSALDTGLRASTRKAVAELLTEAGVTTLLVTHDQEEALSIADQVAVMRDGRFTKVGTPQQVYLQPDDRFTAEFLGDCVLLPCVVTAGSRGMRARPRSRARRRIGRARDADAAPGTTRRHRGVRRRRGAGVATVLASEFRGHDVLLTVDPGGDAAPIIVRQHSVDPPPVDAKVRVDVDGRRGRSSTKTAAEVTAVLVEHLASHGDRVAVITDDRAADLPRTRRRRGRESPPTSAPGAAGPASKPATTSPPW